MHRRFIGPSIPTVVSDYSRWRRGELPSRRSGRGAAGPPDLPGGFWRWRRHPGYADGVRYPRPYGYDLRSWWSGKTRGSKRRWRAVRSEREELSGYELEERGHLAFPEWAGVAAWHLWRLFPRLVRRTARSEFFAPLALRDLGILATFRLEGEPSPVWRASLSYAGRRLMDPACLFWWAANLRASGWAEVSVRDRSYLPQADYPRFGHPVFRWLAMAARRHPGAGKKVFPSLAPILAERP